jgi:hypothetical protein
VAAILKMATGRNFSMPGIISGHHNLPTYEMSLKSDNVEFVRYCGGLLDVCPFQNGCQNMELKKTQNKSVQAALTIY